MVIKNKDGTNYKLKGPNPVASKQNHWDDNFEMHNMEWEEVELPDADDVKKFNSDFEVKDVFSEPIEVAIPEERPTVAETPEIVDKLKVNRKEKAKNIVDVWVLPAQIEHNPEAERGKQYTIKYFDKKLVESIIVHNDTFHMVFWTNVDFCKCGSIIYLWRNSEGDVLRESSWWKVDKVLDETEDERLKKSGGFIHVCVPSEYTPDFSD